MLEPYKASVACKALWAASGLIRCKCLMRLLLADKAHQCLIGLTLAKKITYKLAEIL